MPVVFRTLALFAHSSLYISKHIFFAVMVQYTPQSRVTRVTAKHGQPGEKVQ